jgi:predicted kinase
VLAREEERAGLAALAGRLGAEFHGIWLAASTETTTRRIRDRRGDASDATPEVALAQIARGAGAMAWRIVSADGAADDVLARARALLGID